MKTLGALSKEIERQFVACGIDEAKLDARLLISDVLNIEQIDYVLEKEVMVSDDDYETIMGFVHQRLKRVPMSQIFGEKEFWSRSFKVTPDTLTPRPDSETLIEAALTYVSEKRTNIKILDLGTGTGCLLLTLLSEITRATGLGLDISEKALDVARENALKLKVSERAEFRFSDWTSNLTEGEKFDIIISNPPYIGLTEKESLSPEVKDHEPEIALFSGPDGLDDYRNIASQIGPYVQEHGCIILEIGYQQASAVKKIFTSQGFNTISLYKDLAGRDRCLLIKK